MKLYLVRHGLCRHNMPNPDLALNDPFCSTFIPEDQFVLTPQGILQAELTGWYLRNVDFDCIYSSYLIRTVQTASGVLKFQNRVKTLHILPEIAEITDFSEGHFPFLPTETYQRVWREIDPPTDPTVTGMTRSKILETPEIMTERARRITEYLLKKHGGTEEKVLLVSHGSFMETYLLPTLMCTTPADPYPKVYPVDNCSVTVIEFDQNNNPHLRMLNATGHLGTTALASEI